MLVHLKVNGDENQGLSTGEYYIDVTINSLNILLKQMYGFR